MDMNGMKTNGCPTIFISLGDINSFLARGKIRTNINDSGKTFSKTPSYNFFLILLKALKFKCE